MSTGTVLRHSCTSLGKSPSLPELEQRLNPKQLQRGLKHFCFLGIGLNSQHLGSIQVDRGDAKTNLALMAITFV